MMIGTVLGTVALVRGVPGAAERRFVRVQSGECLVTALDPVGVQRGEPVLLAVGDSAGRLCPELPVDAVVLGALAEQ